MLAEDRNDDQQGRAPKRLQTATIMTVSTLSVSACVGAIAIWPNIGGAIGAGITGVALLLQVHETTRR